MNVEGLSDSGLNRIGDALNYLAERQEALAANLSNQATPGYRTVDVAFVDALQAEELGLPMTQTSRDHFDLSSLQPKPRMIQIAGLDERPDGNNVHLDRELVAMTLNRLRFQMALQYASSRLRALRAAIQERSL
jgi:flagellar basal-body rod protein FlgB